VVGGGGGGVEGARNGTQTCPFSGHNAAGDHIALLVKGLDE
jgi:hypothetical protein